MIRSIGDSNTKTYESKQANIKNEKEDKASFEDIPEEEYGHKNADDDDLGGGMGGDKAGSIEV